MPAQTKSQVFRLLKADSAFVDYAKKICMCTTYKNHHNESVDLSELLIIQLGPTAWITPFFGPARYHGALRFIDQDNLLQMTNWGSSVHLTQDKCRKLKEHEFLKVGTPDSYLVMVTNIEELRKEFSSLDVDSPTLMIPRLKRMLLKTKSRSWSENNFVVEHLQSQNVTHAKKICIREVCRLTVKFDDREEEFCCVRNYKDHLPIQEDI